MREKTYAFERKGTVMKIKRVLSLFLAFIMVIGLMVVQVSADDGIKVLLDGEVLEFDVPPQIIDARTMVPMRKIFEAMGAEVDWNGDTETVTAVKDDITVIMQINNTTIKVNDAEVVLDVPPQLIDGRTLVPARAVAESLNAKVDWNNDTQTVVITKHTPDTPKITSIDLSKQTEFACNVGATITYGFDEIWNGTIGTDYVPFISMKNTAYRGQVVLISPLYANFALDDNQNAKVTYTISRRKPGGQDEIIVKDAVAIDGKSAKNQIVKSMTELEYRIDETDPLGEYIFTVESKDVIGNKTAKNTFHVVFSDYKYVKNEFKSDDELLDFVYNYGRNPDPDRIIDAAIYAEKHEMITYPIIFTGLVEMMAKNAYIAKAAVAEFEKEFGVGGTETLRLVENTAATYLDTILNSNPPTYTQVAVSENIDGNIMLYGSAIGAYLTAASYGAAKLLVQSQNDFSEELMEEYGVFSLKQLAQSDPLFKAYCTNMLYYNIDEKTKDRIEQILK